LIDLGFQRRLRHNNRNVIPSDCLFLDTETDQRIDGKLTHHTFKLGAINHVRLSSDFKMVADVWKEFTEADLFFASMLGASRANSHLWVYGHNIHFDLQALGFFERVKKTAWRVSFLYEKGMVFILALKFNDRKISFVSTTNYFDASLKELGHMIGLEKLEVDFDKVSETDLMTYCRRDAEIVKCAMLSYFKFIRENNLGMNSYTRSSQAFNAYRHRFLKHEIFLHDCKEVKLLERSAYHGGRVEAFFIGHKEGEEYVKLDVNAIYPFVMREYLYPCRLSDYQTNIDKKTCAELLKNYLAVARVNIETDEPLYPIRHEGKLVFPVGAFEAFLCTEGLYTALYKNHLVKIHEIALYEPADLFSSFVNTLYALRLRYAAEENIIMVYLVKKMMNSLYGKFGQYKSLGKIESNEVSELFCSMTILDKVTGKRWHESYVSGTTITDEGKEESPNSYPAIAAHITEHARFNLWRLMEKAGRENVFYCDTDSLITQKSITEKLKDELDPIVMGKLKIEESANTLDIFGAKDYKLGDKQKIKGVPKNAEVWGDGVYKYDTWLKLKGHLQKDNSKDFIVRRTIKKLSRIYDKGEVQKDGRVIPLRFS